MKIRGFLRNCSYYLTISASIWGCGPANSSNPAALVTTDQQQLAFDIINNIDYLPFTYRWDGCYARSLYMSMELAAAGIPSSSLYVVGHLEPTDQIKWKYHVAPLITSSDLKNAVILDPSLSPKPELVQDWVYLADQVDPDGRYRYWLTEGSSYIFDQGVGNSVFTKSSAALLDDPATMGSMVSNFEDMKPFDVRHLRSACYIMQQYTNNSRPPMVSQEASDSKTRKIASRTRELVEQLFKLGKISHYQYYGENPSQWPWASICPLTAGRL